ncbi:PREDICTED: lipopolysaccharide-induced tumor necrosis factor-alpha factor-like [Rhagoletis zephyria]|uniref:lipopolysaccharide-induced tumor necrosis factor-alpha factor-like n=1 Tax=Rhagoletis zephyria TaxID=28612 RepID=UPI000811AA42|nr:PREDICTED: lipopolysaccharide-induced tumor necrosis factor-alpha factor-like [Rhagoletis zephyria]XP_017492400.1 PREDICTED: lipopolysaccharide-induced tumor necrosis factor-alpha factor-like [Rhagoletis zephyria]XP_017493697.1 PREDICTED: lipopolysaccharide-induced tumor necrosis factor-alpha factor-like [Rhagoletis zephyria]
MSTPIGPIPCSLTCPNCSKQVNSRLEYRASSKTHIIALLLAGMLCIPCAGMLYCTQCARNVEHYCPTCNAFLGVYDR